MFEKLALKRLTALDLSLFRWHSSHYNPTNQKSITLNGNVLVDRFYPTLPIVAQSNGGGIPLSLLAYGPGLEGQYELQRRIVKSRLSKNWDLVDELIPNPLDSPERFNSLAEGDFIIFDFFGDLVPSAARAIFIAKAVQADTSLHTAFDSFLGDRKMVALLAEQLLELVTQANPAAQHPIHNLTLDADLEDAALGGIQGIQKLRSKPSNRQMSQDILERARKKAKRIGEIGETCVDSYFRIQKSQRIIKDFEWVSQQNAIAPNDFWILLNDDRKVLVDVKSTEIDFSNPIHVSYNELLQMSSGSERYDLYRIYAIGEKTIQLRIAEDVGKFATLIIKTFSQLPQGVSPDGISILPSLLTFQTPIIIPLPDELLDE